MSRHSTVFAVAVLVVSFTTFAAEPGSTAKKPLPPAASDKIDFEKHVKPILAANCYKCHAGEKQKGGLKLDSRPATLEGGNSGSVVTLGKSADSKLIHAVAGWEPDAKMPPGEKSLSAAEVGILRAWIDQNLPYSAAVTAMQTEPVKSSHWAFQPIRKPELPNTKSPGRHPVDAFVRARLEKEKLVPSPAADRATLFRRVHLDLTGLPPNRDDVLAFLADESPNAYEKTVDKLLDSPHYGERWGRHWLDAARYADSDGYEKDTGRPFAYRYRDWVISALNRDLPFDRFTVEQLAGDLLPNATTEQKIATGFHRNTLTNKEGGVDQEEFRVAAVVDRVNTTGTVWLGLTVGCCQCHDHKYDPLAHREYYQLFAYFNSDRETDILAPLPSEADKLEKLAPALKAEREKLVAAVAEAKAKNLSTSIVFSREQALITFDNKNVKVAKAPTLTLGPTRPTHVMIRGDFLRKGVEVKSGTPAVLPARQSSGTRLDFANWLVSPENPLTARVAVNWVWAKYFGRGLVSTPEDFGTQGQPSSHPELLDWLASEFRSPNGLGWSLKKLHRLIVTSDTYKQSSATRPELIEKDPLNVLLARQSRLRLESEIVRDEALAVSGLLTRTVGGPSIRPPQPTGISELTYAGSAKWAVSTGPDRYRRGLYIWFQRTSPFPMLMTFDNPDSNVCMVRRERSNTPLQALTLLNDVVFVEAAQALAKRARADCKSGCDTVTKLFQLTLGRNPTKAEELRVLKLHRDFSKLAETNPTEAAKLVGSPKPDNDSIAESAAWVAVARTLMNLDEFVTRE